MWPEASEPLRKLLTDLTHTPRDRLKPFFDADLTARLSPINLTILHGLAEGHLDPIVNRVALQGPEAYISLQRLYQIKEPSYIDDVVRRYQLCVFHLLRERWDRENPGSKHGAFPLAVASSFPGHDSKIAANVRYWTRSGALLQRLSTDLGGLGILLVLPDTVSRSTWEAHISPTSARYDEAVQRLRSSGLCEFAERNGAYRVGSAVAQAFGLVQDGRSLLFPSSDAS